jgi:hypothetical protein
LAKSLVARTLAADAWAANARATWAGAARTRTLDAQTVRAGRGDVKFPLGHGGTPGAVEEGAVVATGFRVSTVVASGDWSGDAD